MRLSVTALIALLGATLALTACGGTDQDGAATSTPTTAAAAATSAVPFDQAFIDAMVPHHQQAIAMAVAAKEAGLSQPDLVEIADAIITTQQNEINQMLAWRNQWYGSGEVDPDGLDALGFSTKQMGMQHNPADLNSARDVNAAFAELMMDHHNGAIAMAELALLRTEHPEIEQLAQAIIDAQQREIQIMSQHTSSMMDHT